ncbi:bifunctional precorrin-2 dehydrogenase/sirohydrochlorin ferrochelatase, partial [Flavobacteriaceae bacterium]|nr:bifunctional precorrin-2 dehydrogenase/sirohydrochlorin ferrochelatase [Flavobacteriaceae bacterium]
NKYRDTIKGDFEEKVDKMNEFTKNLVGDVKDKIKE